MSCAVEVWTSIPAAMDRVVKIEIEEVPEVTVNDVYVDIDGAAEEAENYMHLDPVDVKPSLMAIKKERISPLPWQWNQNANFTDVRKYNGASTCGVDKDVKYIHLNKKRGKQPDHSDEEIDVDTPYCGTLWGQTRAKTCSGESSTSTRLPNPCLGLERFSGLLGSRFIYHKKTGHSSQVGAKKSERSRSSQKGTKPRKSVGAKKSVVARDRSKSSNVARKSTSRQSKPPRNPGVSASSDVGKKPTVRQSEEPNSSAFPDVNKSLPSKVLTPRGRSDTSACLNVARKSTGKQAKSFANILPKHSPIKLLIKTVDSKRCVEVKSHEAVVSRNEEHHTHHRLEQKSNDMNGVFSDNVHVQCPDTVSGFQKPVSGMAFKRPTCTESVVHGASPQKYTTAVKDLNQGVLPQTRRTVFTLVERSPKKIPCPECSVEIVQWSLRGHLKTVHCLPLRICAKCKTGFTDLNQYSEHYAFHLQEEEDQIAGILRSPLNAGCARQRLTRRQRQCLTKRKPSFMVKGQRDTSIQSLNMILSGTAVLENSTPAHKKLLSMHENNASPVKRPQPLSAKRIVSSSIKNSSAYSESLQGKAAETQKGQTGTVNNRPEPEPNSPLRNSAGGKLETRRESLSSDLSESSSMMDLPQPSSPSVQSEESFCVQLTDQTTDCPPPSKRQRLQEHVNSDAEVSKKIFAEATVPLVSLETASQPFSCKTCLKAFHTALVCPSSFRQYFRQLSASKPLKELPHSSPPSKQEEEPYSVAPDDDISKKSETKGENEVDETASVPPATMSVSQQVIGNSKPVSPKKEHVETRNGYRCNMCNRSFQYHSELLRHVPYHSYQFACGFCRKAYQQIADLFDHFEISHGGKMRFRCKYCDRRFEDLVHFQTHMKLHKDGTVVRCTMCNKKYDCSQEMKQHFKNSHGPCEVCGKKFLEESQFAKHKRTAHIQQTKQTVPKRLYCMMCSRRFQTVQGLLSHKRRHHQRGLSVLKHADSVMTNRTPSKSDVSSPSLLCAASEEKEESVSSGREERSCSVKLKSQTNVRTPKLSPASIKEVSVPQRDKLTCSYSHSKNHSAASKSSSLKCKVCHKLLHSVKGLKSHYSLCHSGVSVPKLSLSGKSDCVHGCPYCDKRFIFRSSVYRHVRLNHRKTTACAIKDISKQKSGAQKCRKCGKDFSRQSVKTFLAHTKLCHAKQTHNGETSKKGQPLTHKCVLCEKTFAWRKNVIRHMVISHRLSKKDLSYNMTSTNFVKRTHEAKKTQLYLCKICRECFTVEKSYKLHQANRHSGKSNFFQCRLCWKEITRNANVDLHMSRVHPEHMPFLCRGCNKEFDSAKAILSHKCCHSNATKCWKQKNLKSCQKLKQVCHMKGPAYRYRCAACSAGFYIAREWTKHMQKHFDVDKDSADVETEHSTSQPDLSSGDTERSSEVSCHDSDGEEDFKVESCDDSEDKKTACPALFSQAADVSCKETILSGDYRTNDIAESGQPSSSILMHRQSSHDHHVGQSTNGNHEEKEDKPVETKGSGLSVGNKPDMADPLNVNSKAEKMDIRSSVVESSLTLQNLDSQDELSLGAFEDLYESAWTSEYAVESIQTTMNCGNAIHSNAERTNSMDYFDSVEDGEKVTEDAVEDRFQQAGESLDEKEHDFSIERETLNAVTSDGRHLHESAIVEENTLYGEMSESDNPAELISDTQKSYKEKEDAEDTQIMEVSEDQDEHVAQEKGPERSTEEDITAVMENQNKDPAANDEILDMLYEAASSCDSQHKCDISVQNASHVSVSLGDQSPEFLQAPREESQNLSEATFSRNFHTDHMSEELEIPHMQQTDNGSNQKNQTSSTTSINHKNETSNTETSTNHNDNTEHQKDERTTTVSSCQDICDSHASQTAGPVDKECEVQGKSVNKEIDFHSETCSKSNSDCAQNKKTDIHENQTDIQVSQSEESHKSLSDGHVGSLRKEVSEVQEKDQHQSLIAEAQDTEKGVSVPENQNKNCGVAADLLLNEAGSKVFESMGHENLVNNCMLKCVKALKSRLAIKDDQKLFRKGNTAQTSESLSLCNVQNAQEVSDLEERAIGKGDKNCAGVDGSTGTKFESRPSIFDIISSENDSNCPVCGIACKNEDDLKLHKCLSKGVNVSNESSSVKPSTEPAIDVAGEHEQPESGRTVNLMETDFGMCCNPPVNSGHPHRSTDSAVMDIREKHSADGMIIAYGETKNCDSPKPESSNSHDDPLKGLVVDEDKHTPATLNSPSKPQSNYEENNRKNRAYSDTDDANQDEGLGDQNDTGHNHTDMSEVHETAPSKYLQRCLNGLKGKLTEAMDSARKDSLSLFTVFGEDKGAQNTKELNPGQSLHGSVVTGYRGMDKCSTGSNRLMEAKCGQRLNIFDMLSSDKNSDMAEYSHSKTHGKSTEHSVSFSLSATKQKGICDEAMLAEESPVSDKDEIGCEQPGPEDWRNNDEWVNSSTQSLRPANDMSDYMPVGLYIRKQCAELHQNQEHTKNVRAPVGTSVFCNTWPSGSSRTSGPQICTAEKQNERVISETDFSTSTPPSSSVCTPVGEYEGAEEIHRRKLTGNKKVASDLTALFDLSNLGDRDSAVEQQEMQIRFVMPKTKQNKKLNSGIESENSDIGENVNKGTDLCRMMNTTTHVNQAEESKGTAVVEQQDHSDCRPCETKRKVSDDRHHHCVKSYMTKLRHKLSLKHHDKSRGKEKPEHTGTHLQNCSTERLQENVPSVEKQILTNSSEKGGESTRDGDKPGKKEDVRSNIFDLLSLDSVSSFQVEKKENGDKNSMKLCVTGSMPPQQNVSHSSFCTIDFTPDMPGPREERTDFTRMEVASDAHSVCGDQQAGCSKAIGNINSPPIVSKDAYLGDNQAETELRKQLTELLLNSQQSSAVLNSLDTMTSPSVPKFDGQDKPPCITQNQTKGHNAPAKNSANVTHGPFEYLTECQTMGPSMTHTQQELDLCKGSEAQYTPDGGKLKPTSGHENDASPHSKYLSYRPSEQLSNVHENQTSNGVQRYMQTLREKLVLGENFIRNKLGASQGCSVQGPKRQSVTNAQDGNHSYDICENQTVPDTSKKSDSANGGRQVETSFSASGKRLNIFDVLTENGQN